MRRPETGRPGPREDDIPLPPEPPPDDLPPEETPYERTRRPPAHVRARPKAWLRRRLPPAPAPARATGPDDPARRRRPERRRRRPRGVRAGRGIRRRAAARRARHRGAARLVGERTVDRVSVYEAAGGRAAFLGPGRRAPCAVSRRPRAGAPLLAWRAAGSRRTAGGLLGRGLRRPAALLVRVRGALRRCSASTPGHGMEPDLGERFVACFVAAADDAGLPPDPELRGALRAYMEWATNELYVYNDAGSGVPPGLPCPVDLGRPRPELIRGWHAGSVTDASTFDAAFAQLGDWDVPHAPRPSSRAAASRGSPGTSDRVFRVASIGKLLAGYAILIGVEEGAVRSTTPPARPAPPCGTCSRTPPATASRATPASSPPPGPAGSTPTAASRSPRATSSRRPACPSRTTWPRPCSNRSS